MITIRQRHRLRAIVKKQRSTGVSSNIHLHRAQSEGSGQADLTLLTSIILELRAGTFPIGARHS